MTAHHDDPLVTHLLRREDAEQAHRAVADDHHGRARLDVGRVGGEPAPVPSTSDVVSRLGTKSSDGTSGVGTSVPSAADDELSRLDRLNRAAHFLDNAAIPVAHRRGPVDRLKPAIGPQIRPAHARGRHPEHRVRRLDDLRRLSVLKADIARAVENGSFHGLSPYSHSQSLWIGG